MRKTGILTALIYILYVATAEAQQTSPAMADTLRAEGKIYVVVLVLATIFAGIIVYLVRLDRKIKKLENNK